MRSSWLATVWNIDWPKTTGSSASVIAKQKQELTDYLDKFVAMNMNGVCFQVRSMCDAMYKSSFEPWSSYLTGTRGVDPGWDPLAFAVEECHKRGLECYAWVNPYRFSTGSSWNTSYDNYLRNNGLLLQHESTIILDPAVQEARDIIVKVCKEIVNGYAVDGILFDDYFYPNGIPTSSSAEDYYEWQESGTSLSFADWRRANVNLMVKNVYDMIQQERPDCRFGISPAGVSGAAASKHGVNPCPVSASDWQYNGIFSDPLAWLEEGTIDFISPQIYWTTTHSTAPFGPLTKWWSYVANHFGRHHYASHSISLLESANTQANWTDISNQIGLSRTYTENDAPGMILYSSRNISGPGASGLGNFLASNTTRLPALVPIIDWKNAPKYGSVKNLTYSNGTLKWSAFSNGNAMIRYTVYAVPKSISLEKATDAKGGFLQKYLQGVTYTPSYTVGGGNYWYAVCIYDGYGYEHEAATYNYTEPQPGPDPDPGHEEGYEVMLDDATYPDRQQTRLESKWFRATRAPFYNIEFDEDGALNRSFTAVDGTVYLLGRTTNEANADSYIYKFNGATGERIGELALSDDIKGETYPANHICHDDNGNLCVSNLTTSINTNPLRIYQIDKETGAATLRAECTYTTSSRVDHIAIKGDVEAGNFTVYAVFSNTYYLASWKVTNGNVGSAVRTRLRPLYPTANDFGIAPNVSVVSDTQILVDGGNTHAALYNISDGSRATYLGSGSLAPDQTYANGAIICKLGTQRYIIYANSNSSDSRGHTFYMCKLGTTESLNLLSGQGLWVIPGNGFGYIDSSTAQMQAVFEERGAGYGRLYIYVPGNGLAAYTLKDLSQSGIEEVGEDADTDIAITTAGSDITLSAPAVVEVYATTGALLYSSQEPCCKASTALPAGTYIVRAKTASAITSAVVIIK